MIDIMRRYDIADVEEIIADFQVVGVVNLITNGDKLTGVEIKGISKDETIRKSQKPYGLDTKYTVRCIQKAAEAMEQGTYDGKLFI